MSSTAPLASPRKDLFAPIEPFESGFLSVGDGHALYWEVCGNPAGKPVVFLHGGPGAGGGTDQRRFFDPAVYRIVLFDQRGAGRSTPAADLTNNTTQALVADIEKLRRHLGVARWMVFGGSWGSTLALAYAQRHPQQVSALILRGIFLGREAEIDWFVNGMGRFFPEAWDRFAKFIPEAERNHLLAAYYRRLTDSDPQVHLPAAKSWAAYEAACATLHPSPETVAGFADDRAALSLARLEAHYMIHRVFLPEAALLAGVAALRTIPGVIIQGRYDVICPPHSAMALQRVWPAAEMRIIADAGHSAMEPGTRCALVAATERFKYLD
jgi:proline iminopeptidase|tara:strand:+ start:758 stop:1732 length:975 start_codon:yes stop_codon:yes gene_type:complete